MLTPVEDSPECYFFRLGKEAAMRRSIDPTPASKLIRTRPQPAEAASPGPEPPAASPLAPCVPPPADSRPWSLRQTLPTARFIGQGDIRFTSVAESAETAEAGQLVLNRVGQDDPVRLVADAMARGAAGIVTEQLLPCPLPQCVVGDVASASASIWSAVLNRPDRKLLTVGVVGSAGKSTTALLIATLVRSLGVRTAYQTDLGGCDGIVQSTPAEPIPAGESMVRWLGDAVDAGCEVAICELTDAQLRHGDHDSIRLDVLVVTGMTDRHRDFGPSALQCALELLVANGAAVASADAPRTVRMLRDSGASVVTYGVRRAAEVTVKVIEQTDGMTSSYLSQGDTTAVMETSLCGGAMAANHAAAATFGILIGQPLPSIAEALGSLTSVPGRLQQIPHDQHANVLVDAGGSPNRVTEALRTARSMRGTGRLWCVLALEGTESPEELARYGELIERFAEQAIVTTIESAKPSFLNLSHQVLDGVKQCAALRLIADHQRAVRWGVHHAEARDTVLLLGGLSSRRPDSNQPATAAQQRTALAELERWVDSERKQSAESKAAKTQTPTDFAAPPRQFRVVG